MKAYLVCLLFQRMTESRVDHGIVTASSADEAIGRFLMQQWPKGDSWSLINKSVIEAKGWVYQPEGGSDVI